MMRKLMMVMAAAAALGAAGDAAAAGRDMVVTYSSRDLAAIVAGACGPGSAKSDKATAHRNAAGEMVYIVADGATELVLYPDNVQCNQISERVNDLWRAEAGHVVAQLSTDDIKPLLLAGESEIRGSRFDVDRSGQYVMVSHGDRSTLSAAARPYRTLVTLPLDGQRVFSRKRNLVVVGTSPATQQLEARVVTVGADGLQAGEVIPLTNMRAGVRVLDYSESTDELLLGGVDPSGRVLFVVYDLASGGGSTVQPQKPGDDMAMFVRNARLRSRLAVGGGGAAQAN